jgi:hypothetical protein
MSADPWHVDRLDLAGYLVSTPPARTLRTVLAGCVMLPRPGSEVESYLSDMRLVFAREGKGGLLLSCPNLLTDMYYQFAPLVSGKTRTDFCVVCGGIMPVERKTRKTCSGAPQGQGAQGHGRTLTSQIHPWGYRAASHTVRSRR